MLNSSLAKGMVLFDRGQQIRRLLIINQSIPQQNHLLDALPADKYESLFSPSGNGSDALGEVITSRGKSCVTPISPRLALRDSGGLVKIQDHLTQRQVIAGAMSRASEVK